MSLRRLSWNQVDEIFRASLIIKGIDGVLEIIGGILLALIHPATLNRLAETLTIHELSQDPRDFLATHLVSATHSLTGGLHVFAVLYLLLHGLVKLLVVIALFIHDLRLYPVALGFLAISILYQIYRIGYNHSFSLSLLTLLDIVIAWLAIREYHHLRVGHSGKA